MRLILIFSLTVGILAADYTLKLEDVKGCTVDHCDIEFNFTANVAQPEGNVRIRDPFRDVDYNIDISNAVASYSVKYDESTQIYDSMVTDALQCSCPPNFNVAADNSPCRTWYDATVPNTPSWEYEVYASRSENDCQYSTSSAYCCYILRPQTVQAYDLYTGFSASLDNVTVTYHKKRYPLKTGVTTEVTDLKLTMITFVINAVMIDSMALAIDPLGKPKTLMKNSVNPDGGYDQSKVGWWKQDDYALRAGFTDKPTILATRASSWKSNIKPVLMQDVPSAIGVSLTPSFKEQPGARIQTAKIFWKYDTSEWTFWDYDAKIAGLRIYPSTRLWTKGDNGLSVTVCAYYPQVCACEPPQGTAEGPGTMLDIKWCRPIKGFMKAYVDKELKMIYMDGSGTLTTSTRHLLQGIGYELPPLNVTMNIRSDTHIQSIVLGNCLPIEISTPSIGETFFATMKSSKAPCAFIVENDSKFYYINSTVRQLEAVLSTNSLIRVRDASGISIYPANSVKVVGYGVISSVVRFDYKSWLCWVVTIILIGCNIALKYFNRFHISMPIISTVALVFAGTWAFVVIPILALLGWKEEASKLATSLKKKKEEEPEKPYVEMKNYEPKPGQPDSEQNAQNFATQPENPKYGASPFRWAPEREHNQRPYPPRYEDEEFNGDFKLVESTFVNQRPGLQGNDHVVVHRIEHLDPNSYIKWSKNN